MNFKRKKPKQNVKCTLCTSHRWYGNNTGRLKPKEEYWKKLFKRKVQSERDCS